MKKRLTMIAMVLMMGLSGCGGSGNSNSNTASPSNESTKLPDVNDLIASVQTNMDKINSMRSEAVIDMAMSSGGEVINTYNTTYLDAFFSPVKMQMFVDVDMGDEESVALEMYVLQDDSGEISTHMSMGDEWLSIPVSQEELDNMVPYNMIFDILNGLQDAKVTGDLTDDTDILKYIVEGNLSSQAMLNLAEFNGILNSILAFGITEDEMMVVANAIENMDVSLLIGEDGMVYEYEVDMQELVQGLMNLTGMAMGLTAEQSEAMMKIEKTIAILRNYDFNEVEDFDIPDIGDKLDIGIDSQQTEEEMLLELLNALEELNEEQAIAPLEEAISSDSEDSEDSE